MSRNFILMLVTAMVVGRMMPCLRGTGGVARAQVSAGQPVLQDNFDDNKKGAMWKLFGQTSKAKSTEVNKRLEFTSSADVNVPFLGYISDKWWIDPNQDFQMRLDLYFDVYSFNDGWISFGVTPESDQPSDQYVAFGIGCSGVFQNYWREWKDGYEVRDDFTSRPHALVTLYISYDAWNDILYLGDAGYGPKSAWQSLPNIVRGRWGRAPLRVFLGLTSENLKLISGSAYVDNFVIEKGKIGSPYQPTDPNDPGNGGGQIQDVTATVTVIPSVIRRQGSDDKVTMLAGLPKEVQLTDWDPGNVPTLSPGGIKATMQTAFVWIDGEVKVLASFSKTALLQAVSTNGEVELYFSGILRDGRSYAGSSPITIE